MSEKLKDASEATTITINEKEYSVNVGNSAKNTLTRNDLKKVKLTGTVSGKEKEVTLDKVAKFRNSDSLSSINRNQQERTLTVTSEIKDGYNRKSQQCRTKADQKIQCTERIQYHNER